MKNSDRSIARKINQLFIGAAFVAFPTMLVLALVLFHLDKRNTEYRTLERVKALLDAQLPLLASDLLHGNTRALIPRMDVLVATQNAMWLQAAIFDTSGKKIAQSDGFVSSLGKDHLDPRSGHYVTPQGYAVSIKPIRSGLSRLGTAVFVARLQPSSELLGQALGASLLILALVLGLLFVATRRYLMRTVIRPIEALIDALPSLSQFVKGGAPLPAALEFNSGELNSLSKALWTTHEQLKSILQKEESLRILAVEKEAALRVSKQVAHDIRSPLAALDATVESIGSVDESRRLIIRRAVSRIRDIANNLRPPVGPGNHQNSNALSVELLSAQLEAIISEKRAEFSQIPSVEIDLFILEGAHGAFSRIASSEFKRAISNLINNAVEAFEGTPGTIRVALSKVENKAFIRILDSGKGIPTDILQDLGRIERSFGKPGGSGSGVFQATSEIRQWGGTLTYSSEMGRGTCAEIGLHLAPSPDWLSDFIPNRRTIAILDDDPTIHEVWNERFKTVEGEQAVVVHFEKPQTLKKWIAGHADLTNTLFLIDFKLIGQQETGLDIIRRLGIARQSMLVTSGYDEATVQKECLLLGIKLIPKGIIPFIPIRGEHGRPAKRSTMKTVRQPARVGNSG